MREVHRRAVAMHSYPAGRPRANGVLCVHSAVCRILHCVGPFLKLRSDLLA